MTDKKTQKIGKGKPGPGRPKGLPNKITQDVREVFKGIMERNAAKTEAWLESVAAVDPGRAMDLLLRMAEYHIPKLARSELTGADGGPVQVYAGKLDERL